MNKILFSFILTALHITSALAQLENTQNYRITTKDGLSDNRVTAILKDSRGFMWVGTTTGLCRYDGYNFTVFQYDASDTNSISGNSIRGLTEDLEGNLWILTKDVLNRFNRKEETFTRFTKSPERREYVLMSLAHSGKLWLVEWSNKVWQFDVNSLSFSPVLFDPAESDSLFKRQIASLLLDKDGDLWLGDTRGGVFKYDISDNNKLMAHYRHNPQDSTSLSNNMVWSLHQDRSGTIWLGTENGLNRMNQDQENKNKTEFVRYHHQPGNPHSMSSDTVYAISEDGAGNLWLRTNKGLNSYNQQTGQFSSWKHENLHIYSMDTYVSHRSLYIEDSDIIWMGLYSQGLMKFVVNKNKFQSIQHKPGNPNSLSSNGVSCFLMDTSGVFWVGTWGFGLNVRIPGKTRFESPSWIHYKHEPGNPSSLSASTVRSIFRDRFGDVWVGAQRGGLNKLIVKENKGTAFLKYKPDSPEGGNNSDVDMIHEDRAGNLWIGGGFGLHSFSRQEEQFYRYVMDTLHPDSSTIGWVNAMGEESSGVIWFSTWNNGLFKISPPFKKTKSKTITGAETVSYRNDKNSTKGLGDWTITTICIPKIHRNMQVWIGTGGGGLFGLKQTADPNGADKEAFKNYTLSDGLPDMLIQGIEEDHQGNLWISTGYGLSRFDPKTESFINYYEEDGLNTNNFGWKSHYISPDNKLYYGNDGILSFYPDSLHHNKLVPPVVITAIRLFNRALDIGGDSPLQESPLEARDISLSHRQNFLTLEFAALNYLKTEQNRYKYFMEGYDLDWIDAGTERTAAYHNLNPGRYTFRVIASNNDGIWNEEGTTLKIRIRPPWWKTIVAYFSYLLVIAVFIYFYNRYRVNKMDKEKRVLEEKVRERTLQLEEHKKELESNCTERRYCMTKKKSCISKRKNCSKPSIT